MNKFTNTIMDIEIWMKSMPIIKKNYIYLHPNKYAMIYCHRYLKFEWKVI